MIVVFVVTIDMAQLCPVKTNRTIHTTCIPGMAKFLSRHFDCILKLNLCFCSFPKINAIQKKKKPHVKSAKMRGPHVAAVATLAMAASTEPGRGCADVDGLLSWQPKQKRYASNADALKKQHLNLYYACIARSQIRNIAAPVCGCVVIFWGHLSSQCANESYLPRTHTHAHVIRECLYLYLRWGNLSVFVPTVKLHL